ncbi:MAG TPA: precorrin-3B C(17)-methyltransferase [Streptosporangiaceae bacterium]|nr:precorrin-3B C(17)-methyltransferase [Streptosporangiaceae bacterium]
MIGLIAVTAAGRAAAEKLAARWPDARRYDGPAPAALPRAFGECDGLVCFLAAGATVRLLAPLLAGKGSDPGVVCVDEALRYAVPVLGAHAGGANSLARRVAASLGAEPVITTASEAAGYPALDELGADLGFTTEPGSDLASVGAAVLSGERVTITVDGPEWPLPALPPNVVPAARPEPGVPAIIVSDRVPPFASPACSSAPASVPSARGGPPEATGPARAKLPRSASSAPGEPGAGEAGPRVVYRPPSLVVGVGASRGVSAAEAGTLVDEALADAGLSPRSVRLAASIDLKSDEDGLVRAAGERGWPLAFFPAADLAAVRVPHPSEAVRAATGTPSVAEAAALLGARQGGGGGVLVVAKRAGARATVAVARVRPRGRLATVGIGPGARDLMTPRAVAELRRASVVVGLDQYADQVADLLRPGTRVLRSGLGAERQRAAAAVAEARAGRAVALIGSGDAGIYAMAGPALELADDTIEVVGVPGVTASLAAAALLGAPLGHDHAVISLSDLHTPWEVIERRVRAAAEADLVTCFYNPASRGRDWQLRRALSVLATRRPPSTPVGLVRDASRPGQAVWLGTLADADPARAGMRALVIVGSSRTRLVAGRMITPRGYRWAERGQSLPGHGGRAQAPAGRETGSRP